jgi:hypothetical protein
MISRLAERVPSALLTCAVSVVVLGIAPACPNSSGHAASLPTDSLAMRLVDDRSLRLRMEATVVARATGVTGFLAQAELDVAAERPGRLHLSARSFFGQPLFAVLTDGETLTLYDTRDGTAVYARGDASRANIERLLGLPLAPKDVVDLLLGGAPDLPAASTRTVRTDGERAILSGVRDDGLAIAIATRRTDDTILDVTMGDGDSAITIAMSEHTRIDGLTMPGVVELAWREAGAPRSVRLTVREARLNGTPLGDEAFQLSPPDGVLFGPLP